MPAFRDGPLIVDRRLSGEALKRLRNVGHGHRINIADDSYEIPDRDDRKVIDFAGNSSELLTAVVRLIPVERVILMAPDNDIDPDKSPESFVAYDAFLSAYTKLRMGGLRDLAILELINRQPSPESHGFYLEANSTTPLESLTYFQAVEPLPFACASIIVGHSQHGPDA